MSPATSARRRNDRYRAQAAPPETTDDVFVVEHVNLRFGGVTSLSDVSLKLASG